MTIEEINEEWPEFDKIVTKETLPFVTLNRKDYNQARTALLRVAELESQLEAYRQENAFQIVRHAKIEGKNKRLVELCKSILLDFGVFADITVRPYRDHTIQLEEIINQ